MGLSEHARRDAELYAIRRRQPYGIDIDGLRLCVAEDVFPPDLGYSPRRLAAVLRRYTPRRALDMGCGSGYLALVLSKNGAREVWAVDNHPPAIACTTENAARNPPLRVRAVESDLFAAISPGTTFDLIVFNQPFYPSTTRRGVFGMKRDGGRPIIERFFTQARGFITPETVMLMPFSQVAGEENDPGVVAAQLGYTSRIVHRESDGPHAHVIHEIRAPGSRPDADRRGHVLV
ncbi:methyltransferase [Sorangium sp. So ce887]|uniref:methyltransferase n=1 Tax=Sorangium sp. So ce887 TaxID=3133324 RepID=UPI003F5FC936